MGLCVCRIKRLVEGILSDCKKPVRVDLSHLQMAQSGHGRTLKPVGCAARSEAEFVAMDAVRFTHRILRAGFTSQCVANFYNSLGTGQNPVDEVRCNLLYQ